MDFEDRALLEDTLIERASASRPPRRRVEILMPQRGAEVRLSELVEKYAKHSFEQRFRVLKPATKAIIEALEQALNLPDPPRPSRASTSRICKAPIRWPRWWFGNTAG